MRAHVVVATIIAVAVGGAGSTSVRPSTAASRQRDWKQYVAALRHNNTSDRFDASIRPRAPVEPGTIDCNDEYKMLRAFNYVTGVCCDQDVPALCPVGDKFPTSFRNKRCALAMNDTATACLPWLDEPAQAFFKEIRDHVATGQHESDTYASNDTKPAWIPLNTNSTAIGPPDSVCGTTLVIGDVKGPPDGHGQITLTAPHGLTLEMNFTTLWLPDGSTVDVFDGTTVTAPTKQLVKKLTGTTEQLRAQKPIRSTGSSLTIQHMDNGLHAGDPKAFSAEITCKCSSDNSCGEHTTTIHGKCQQEPNGMCKQGSCECKDGFTGDTCGENECDRIDCGEWGMCSAGKCYCSGNYTGNRCEVPPHCGPRTATESCQCQSYYSGAQCTSASSTLAVYGGRIAACSGGSPASPSYCYHEDGLENGRIRYKMDTDDGSFVIHYVHDGWQVDHNLSNLTVHEWYYNPYNQSRPPVSGWVADGNDNRNVDPASHVGCEQAGGCLQLRYKDGWMCDSPFVNGTKDGSCGRF